MTGDPCPVCGRMGFHFCPRCLVVFHGGRVIVNSLSLAYLAAAIVLLAGFAAKMSSGWFGDFTILYDRFSSGGKEIEYPLVTWAIIRLCGDASYMGFVAKNSLVNASCFLLAIYVLHRINGRLNLDTLVYFVATLSVYEYLFYNWDVVAVLFTLLSLFAYMRERFTLGGVFLALGAFTKIYPAFLILPTIYFHRRRFWRVVLPFTASLLALAGLYVFAVQDWYSGFLLFHLNRIPNPDSMGFAILGAVKFLGGDFDAAWRWLSPLLTAALGLSLPLFIHRYRRASLPLLWAATLCAVLLTSKVYSPQYNLWLLPLFALVPVNKAAFYVFEASSFSIMALFSIVWNPDLWLLNVPVVARHLALAFIALRYGNRVTGGEAQPPPPTGRPRLTPTERRGVPKTL